jgi:hypothetical protein
MVALLLLMDFGEWKVESHALMHRLLAGRDGDVLSSNTKRNRWMIIGRNVRLKNRR